jgi:hypothetical protein
MHAAIWQEGCSPQGAAKTAHQEARTLPASQQPWAAQHLRLKQVNSS